MSFYQTRTYSRNFCDCSDDSSAFQRVQNGLSMTPADIQRCVSNGLPVSTASVDMFLDGVSNPSTVLPIDEMRGVDIVDCWNASHDAKQKFVSAHNNDVKLYGN